MKVIFSRVPLLLGGYLFLFVAATAAFAQPSTQPVSPPAGVAKPATATGAASPAIVAKPAAQKGVDWFEINGFYTIWGLNQHRFLLGKAVELDDADYIVHMLRVNLRLGTKKFGVVTRFDAAQGWWGANNSPDVENRASESGGTLTNAPVYNPYALFRNKDTNYGIHFDHAYLYLEVPWVPFPVRVQAGRQYFGVGNKLVLDEDYDGIIVSAAPTKWLKLEFMWGKISEGKGAFKFPSGLLMTDKGVYGDADLFGGRAFVRWTNHRLELFGLHYRDSSDSTDWTYLPNGVGYLRNRFVPNLSKVTAFGLALDGKCDCIGDGLTYKFEADLLVGSDDIANANFAGGLLDVNDGDLMGYNFYLNVVQKFAVGIPADLGLTFGLGSGDDDLRSGRGNINKIQTMGFFPLTNVWEDSVMPDIAGISPQGLGSPVSRGYRELENTIALQLKLGVQPWSPLRMELSYTYLRATQAIQAWDATGPLDASSSDIGHEIDLNIKLDIYKKRVSYVALLGAFMPGTGAAYLINGNDAVKKTVFEAKQVLTVTF
ncbi:MAG: hypothetical protein H6707_20885 [Deltaproteobacteria bacterium]|nr:hypothetical protein [Deltaproteobacteria bacterium]